MDMTPAEVATCICDIYQALDEEEFLLRVRELIRVEQDERLPF